MTQGQVLEVSITPAGGELATAHVLGDTTLELITVEELSDAPGTVQIEGTNYDYTAIDRTTNIVTITVGTVIAYEEATKVLAMPYSEEKWAMVEVQNSDEPISARVAHGLKDKMVDGVREPEEQETVVLEMKDGDWTVTDLIQEVPSVDGVYINPSTLPAPGGPTTVPGTSPDIKVSGNAAGLVVQANPVEAGTRIRYYVSTTDGFVPGPTTFYAESQSTVLVVNSLPGSTDQLLPEVPYYVVAQAVNNIGVSPDLSNQASDTLHMDVVSSAILAELVAGFILTGKIQVGQAYIDANEGIVIPQPDGGTIKFPVNGDFAQITAHLIARSLNVSDNFTLNGQNNQLMGALVAAEGITKPQTAPLISQEHRAYHAFDVLGSNVFHGMMEDPADSTRWLFPFAFFGTGVRKMTKAGLDWAGDLTISGIPSAISDFQPFGGMIYASGTSRYVMLGTATNSDGTGAGWWLVTFSRSGDTLSYTGRLEITKTTATFPYQIRMSYNSNTGDGHIWYMNENADNKLRVIRFDPTSTPTRDSGTIAAAVALPGKYNIGGAYTGNGDFGSQRHIVNLKGSSQLVFTGAYNSLTRQPNDEFIRAGNANIMGFCWDGTRFWSFNDNGDIYKHSTNKAPSGRSTVPIQARHTWFDNAGTIHETDGGPIASMSLGARTWLRVETQPAPDTDGDPGDPEKADTIRVYVSSDGTTTPRLQTADGWSSMSSGTVWRKKTRTVTSVVTTSGDKDIVAPGVDSWSTDDVGGAVTGTGVPASTTITGVKNNGRTATMSNAASASGTVSITVTPTVSTRSGLFESINNAAAAPPGSNGFALVGRAPGAYKSTRADVNGALINLKGDGSGRIGPWQFDNLGQTLKDFGPERPGTVILWPSSSTPLDCAQCQGQAVSRPISAGGSTDLYKRLWDLFGTGHGAGNGTTTFNLPDYRGRVLIGLGTYAPNASSNDGQAEADRGLDHKHNVTIANHTHGLGAGTTAATQSGSGVQRMTGGGSTGTGGADTVTSAAQPKNSINGISYNGINYIIKL